MKIFGQKIKIKTRDIVTIAGVIVPVVGVAVNAVRASKNK